MGLLALGPRERCPSAPDVTRSGQGRRQSKGQRRRSMAFCKLVLGQLEDRGARRRTGELANHTSAVIVVASRVPRARVAARFGSLRPSPGEIFERPRRGIPLMRERDGPGHDLAFGALVTALITAYRPRRGDRPDQRHQPARTPDDAERIDGRGIVVGCGGPTRRLELLSPADGLFQPPASRVRDRVRHSSAAAQIPSVRCKVRPSHTVDAPAGGFTLVGAQPQPARRAGRQPMRARTPSGGMSQQRPHPARRLPVVGIARRLPSLGLDSGDRVARLGDGRVENLAEQHAQRPQVRPRPGLAVVAQLGRRVAWSPSQRLRSDVGRETLDRSAWRPWRLRHPASRRHAARRTLCAASRRRGEYPRRGARREPAPPLRLPPALCDEPLALGRSGGARVDRGAVDPLRREKARSRIDESGSPPPRDASEKRRFPRQGKLRGSGASARATLKRDDLAHLSACLALQTTDVAPSPIRSSSLQGGKPPSPANWTDMGDSRPRAGSASASSIVRQLRCSLMAAADAARHAARVSLGRRGAESVKFLTSGSGGGRVWGDG